MTSPLQAAFDQVVEAEAPPEQIICTVATPRQSAMTGVYMGEELRARSSRPGAYDAMALPSLFNGQKHDPLAPKEPPARKVIAEAPLSSLAVAPLPTPPKSRKVGPARAFPTAGRTEKPAYQPRPWSAPAKVIEHLRAVGGFISHVDVSKQFHVTRNAITATFKPALQRGALVRQEVGGYVGFSLPGWTPPIAPTTSPSDQCGFEVAEATLKAREAQVALWQSYLHALQARAAFDALAERLRPLIPLENMPAL